MKFLVTMNKIIRESKHRFIRLLSYTSDEINANKQLAQRKKLTYFEEKKIQARRAQFCNNEFYLQTLGSGSYGAPRSLFIYTNKHKFLFNCGEGTRRVASELNKDMINTSHILITHNSWQNVSGIPCLQEFVTHHSKDKIIKVYGPKKLVHLMKIFSNLDHETGAELEYVDTPEEEMKFDGINIQTVHILRSSNSDERENDYRKRFEYSASPSEHVNAYICKVLPCKGYVNTDKLVTANVPPGPLCNDLKEGKSVTLSNGKIITPEEVSVDVYKTTESFIVIEIPHVDYLDSLLTCKAFAPYQTENGGSSEGHPELIVHFGPPEVLKDPRYSKWVDRFSPSVAHLALNERSVCTGLKRSFKLQLQLNQFLPHVFPLLQSSGLTLKQSPPKEEASNADDIFSPCTFTKEYQFNGPTVQSQTLLKFHIRPPEQFDSEECPVVNPESVIQSIFENEFMIPLFTTMKSAIEEEKLRMPTPKRPFPNILFLGTGSACSSSIRNVSSILLNADEKDCFLLDCGEGTLNQLMRFMGKEEARSTLRRMKFIFISHFHRDHHLGVASVLLERREAFREAGMKPTPLYLLAPSGVVELLTNISHSFTPLLNDVIVMNNINLVKSKQFYKENTVNRICKAVGLKNIAISFVIHIRNSFAISLSHADGWKITYSGDTMPCNELVALGKDSDVLIHEATFEDGMERSATTKRHSTVSQAINMGKRMNAKFIMLTHFSQRYAHVPLLEDGIPDNVGVAFDNMKITLDDLPYLPHLYPPIKELFFEDIEKLKLQAYWRNKREN